MSRYLCPTCWRTGPGVAAPSPASSSPERPAEPRTAAGKGGPTSASPATDPSGPAVLAAVASPETAAPAVDPSAAVTAAPRPDAGEASAGLPAGRRAAGDAFVPSAATIVGPLSDTGEASAPRAPASPSRAGGAGGPVFAEARAATAGVAKERIGPRFWLEPPARLGRVEKGTAPAPEGPAASPKNAPAPAASATARDPANGAAHAGRGALAAFFDTVLGAAEEPAAPAAAAAGRELACVCGAPLAGEARLEGPPSLLGFAGASGSGKSVLLLAMLQELETAGQAPFLLAGLGGADRRFRGLRRELFLDGSRPAPQGGDGGGHGWKVLPAGAGLRGGSAQFVGQHEPGEHGTAAGGESGARWRRHLELLTRLVFVLDGARIASDLGLAAGDAWSGEPAPADLGAADLAAFAAACAGLGKRSRDIAVAIVVAKADLLTDAEPWAGLAPDGGLAGTEREEKIRQLLQASCRGQIGSQARQLFRRAGFFAVSGLGFRPAADDLDPKGRLRRRPAPSGVLAPLEFLLADILPRPAGRGAEKSS